MIRDKRDCNVQHRAKERCRALRMRCLTMLKVSIRRRSLSKRHTWIDRNLQALLRSYMRSSSMV